MPVCFSNTPSATFRFTIKQPSVAKIAKCHLVIVEAAQLNDMTSVASCEGSILRGPLVRLSRDGDTPPETWHCHKGKMIVVFPDHLDE